MKEITYDEALHALGELAAERPDYVYSSPVGYCRYTEKDGSAGCIVGHVLDRLGLERPAFDDATNDEGVAELGYKMDPRTERLLVVAQEYQDTGTPWGEAVKVAKEYFA